MRTNQMIDLLRYNKLLGQSQKQDAKKNAILAQQQAATASKAAEEEAKAAEGAKAANNKDGIVDPFAKFWSCGIEEIKIKAMSKPGEHKDLSCFIASKAQIAEAAKKKEQIMRAVMA